MIAQQKIQNVFQAKVFHQSVFCPVKSDWVVLCIIWFLRHLLTPDVVVRGMSQTERSHPTVLQVTSLDTRALGSQFLTEGRVWMSMKANLSVYWLARLWVRTFILVRAILWVSIVSQIRGLDKDLVCISSLIFDKNALVITNCVHMDELHIGSPEYLRSYNFLSCLVMAHTHKCRSSTKALAHSHFSRCILESSQVLRNQTRLIRENLIITVNQK